MHVPAQACSLPSLARDSAGLYAVTRVIQTVFLVWLFAVGYGEMSGCGKVAMWWANLVLL